LLMLMFIGFLTSETFGASITVKWDANAPEEYVVNYRIYYVATDGVADKSVDTGNITVFKLNDVPTGLTYYWITAVDKDGLESKPSSPAILFNMPPTAPSGFIVKSATVTYQFIPR